MISIQAQSHLHNRPLQRPCVLQQVISVNGSQRSPHLPMKEAAHIAGRTPQHSILQTRSSATTTEQCQATAISSMTSGRCACFSAQDVGETHPQWVRFAYQYHMTKYTSCDFALEGITEENGSDSVGAVVTQNSQQGHHCPSQQRRMEAMFW